MGIWRVLQALLPRPHRGVAAEYVYVEDDGGARALTAEERAYLAEQFLPGDGARPYIKGRYGQRTPDGRLAGFLRRDQLPRHVRVRPG